MANLLRYVGRVLRLRCPWCGKGPLLRHWLAVRERCPVCGLQFERGDQGYQVGSYVVNLIVIELVFAAIFVGIAVKTWPDVPWNAIQYGGAAVMVLGPIAFFPFARGLFLAADLVMRPPTAEDFPPV